MYKQKRIQQLKTAYCDMKRGYYDGYSQSLVDCTDGCYGGLSIEGNKINIVEDTTEVERRNNYVDGYMDAFQEMIHDIGGYSDKHVQLIGQFLLNILFYWAAVEEPIDQDDVPQFSKVIK